MKKMLGVPVAENILEIERQEAIMTAKNHTRWALSRDGSVQIGGRQLNFQERFSRDLELAKKDLPVGVKKEVFVCLRCGECCYYSYLDNTRRLRPGCEQSAYIPRRIIDNNFLPAGCRIHQDPRILVNGQPLNYPHDSFPDEFEIVADGKKHEKCSDEDGVRLFGKDFWGVIKLRNTLCTFSCPGAQFGPCVQGIKVWEKEKSLHPDVLLPSGVGEQLEVVRLFRERIDEYLEIFERKGKEALEGCLK